MALIVLLAFVINALVADHYTDVFQKLSAVEEQRRWVVESGAHMVKDQL